MARQGDVHVRDDAVPLPRGVLDRDSDRVSVPPGIIGSIRDASGRAAAEGELRIRRRTGWRERTAEGVPPQPPLDRDQDPTGMTSVPVRSIVGRSQVRPWSGSTTGPRRSSIRGCTMNANVPRCVGRSGRSSATERSAWTITIGSPRSIHPVQRWASVAPSVLGSMISVSATTVIPTASGSAAIATSSSVVSGRVAFAMPPFTGAFRAESRSGPHAVMIPSLVPPSP